MNYTCPVCAFRDLPLPPTSFTICPCCGTEFGYDDFAIGYDALRQRWISHGAQWFASDEWPAPQGWNAFVQLAQGGLVARLAGADTESTIVTVSVPGPQIREHIRMIVTSDTLMYPAAKAAA